MEGRVVQEAFRGRAHERHTLIRWSQQGGSGEMNSRCC